VIISVLKSLALGFYHLLLPKTASHGKHSATTACKYLPPAQACYKTQCFQATCTSNKINLQQGHSSFKMQLIPNPDISEATASRNSLRTILSTVAPVPHKVTGIPNHGGKMDVILVQYPVPSHKTTKFTLCWYKLNSKTIHQLNFQL
jgi:hypothetical protein